MRLCILPGFACVAVIRERKPLREERARCAGFEALMIFVPAAPHKR